MKKFFISIVAAFILLGMSNAYAAENFAVEVLDLVNAERAKVGVAPLRLADDLQNASAIRAPRRFKLLYRHEKSRQDLRRKYRGGLRLGL